MSRSFDPHRSASARARRLGKRAALVAVTVVLAAAVGSLGQLAFWVTPEWWWDGTGATAAFYLFVVVTGSLAGFALWWLNRGVPDFATFDAFDRAPLADLVVMPLPQAPRAPVAPGDGTGSAPDDVAVVDGVLFIGGVEVDSLDAVRGCLSQQTSNLEPAWSVYMLLLEAARVRSPESSGPRVLLMHSRVGGDPAMSPPHPMAVIMAAFGIDHEIVLLRNPFDLQSCFVDMSDALVRRSRSRIVFAPGGTAPMQQACAMLSVAEGQYVAYKARDAEPKFYDARVRRSAPLSTMVEF